MPRKPENKPVDRAVIAAVGLLVAAGFAAPASAQAQSNDAAVRHDRCVTLAQTNPKEALARAKLWRQEGGGFAADHCAAMALYALRDYRGAARSFEELAGAMMAMPKADRAGTLDQAGQSWLAADDPMRAKADFDAALALEGNDADLLIDRAEALAMAKQYREAIDDLNHALKIAPGRADAYVYRGSAYRSLNALDPALSDIEHALAIDPNAVLALLERGNIRRLKGDFAGARADWHRVTLLAPNAPAGIAAQVNLDRLARDSDAEATAPAKKKQP